jgi:hypothetical protein
MTQPVPVDDYDPTAEFDNLMSQYNVESYERAIDLARSHGIPDEVIADYLSQAGWGGYEDVLAMVSGYQPQPTPDGGAAPWLAGLGGGTTGGTTGGTQAPGIGGQITVPQNVLDVFNYFVSAGDIHKAIDTLRGSGFDDGSIADYVVTNFSDISTGEMASWLVNNPFNPDNYDANAVLGFDRGAAEQGLVASGLPQGVIDDFFGAIDRGENGTAIGTLRGAGLSDDWIANYTGTYWPEIGNEGAYSYLQTNPRAPTNHNYENDWFQSNQYSLFFNKIKVKKIML